MVFPIWTITEVCELIFLPPVHRLYCCRVFFLYILVEVGIPLALNKIPAFRIQVLRHLVLGYAAPSVYVLGCMLPIQCGGSHWVVGPQW